jgi:hypothetical protein
MGDSERHIVRELVVHGVAYLVAAGVGAIIFSRYYWFFERKTGSPSEARDAFLTCIVVAGGVGPAITLLFFWLHGMLRPSRDG